MWKIFVVKSIAYVIAMPFMLYWLWQSGRWDTLILFGCIFAAIPFLVWLMERDARRFLDEPWD